MNMNKYFIIFFACFLLILPVFGGNIENNKDFGRFLAALEKVESGGRADAFNKKEVAVGIYQIRPAYFKDAQEYDKTLSKYKHLDCYDKNISKRVVIAYMNRYCKTNSFETWAKSHNGGPGWNDKTGEAKNNLAIYYKKIMIFL